MLIRRILPRVPPEFNLVVTQNMPRAGQRQGRGLYIEDSEIAVSVIRELEGKGDMLFLQGLEVQRNSAGVHQLPVSCEFIPRRQESSGPGKTEQVLKADDPA